MSSVLGSDANSRTRNRARERRTKWFVGWGVAAAQRVAMQLPVLRQRL